MEESKSSLELFLASSAILDPVEFKSTIFIIIFINPTSLFNVFPIIIEIASSKTVNEVAKVADLHDSIDI